MQYAKYRKTSSELIPVYVSLGDMETPVWMQQLWEEGEYALYVRKNGCGHCCAAMALMMHGVDMDPHREYALCRELWGAPRDEGERRQGNFQSIAGISKILGRYGVPTRVYGVSDREVAIANILSALEDGKQVIFESHPRPDFPENPFSPGEHWVMAIGFVEDGRILVANSSLRATAEGYQLVDAATIRDALYLGAAPEDDLTWGEWSNEHITGVGYIIVG
ncbi:MAG: hypothetical protein IKC32_03485 [Clostridia bacterium]|nr:hypothetical protein [Clostridia bacterium]